MKERLVEFMTLRDGSSLRRGPLGEWLFRPAGTDVTVKGGIVQRDQRAPGRGVKPRGERLAYITHMTSASRMAGKSNNPGNLLRVGARLSPVLDRAKMPLAAAAGWLGPVEGRRTLDRQNQGLRKAYSRFGMKVDRNAVKQEMAKYRGYPLADRRFLAGAIRAQPPLLRLPRQTA